MHHHISINSQVAFNFEQECRSTIPSSLCLDNLVAINRSVGYYLIVMPLKPISNFVYLIHLFICTPWSITWHIFMSLPLDGFAMSITPLVSSSLLILGPSTSSPNVTALNMKKSHCNTNKPPHDFLVLCEFVPYSLCRKPNRRFAWLVDELSKLQPCLELCRFAWALLKPRLQDRKCHFLREWHENQIIISFLNGWCITRGTQPKREMVCLKSRCCN
jgi:hypothetical protein